MCVCKGPLGRIDIYICTHTYTYNIYIYHINHNMYAYPCGADGSGSGIVHGAFGMQSYSFKIGAPTLTHWTPLQVVSLAPTWHI